MNDLYQGAPRPASTTADYTAADIEVLEGLEPVRRRPGMFIGGTDERALHHLVAELLDNAMDEAVAGHASWIELRLEADGAVTVRDNGRGIPVDPHPKFPDRSALEVIMTTLHSGGKFGAKVYQTAGGLHGVGVSVVNALAEELTVEVARNRQVWRQSYVRGQPVSRARAAGRHRQPARHHGALPARRRDLRHAPCASARRWSTAWRAARPICSAASRSAGSAIRSCSPARGVPEREVFHFPAGLEDFLKATLAERDVRDRAAVRRRGRAQRRLRPGRVGDRLAARRGALRRPLLQHRADPAGRLPRAGAAQRAAAGAARLWRADRQQEGRPDHRRRSGRQRLRAAVVVHPEPAVPGPDQGEAGRTRCRPPGRAVAQGSLRPLALRPRRGRPRAARPRASSRAEERLARKRSKEIARKSATRKLRLPGKLADCTVDGRDGHRDLPGRGRFRRRLGQAGADPRDPGDPAAARQDPERRQRDRGQAARQQGARRSGDRARLRHRQGLPGRRPALRQGRHHDRRRRRRRAHRGAADDLLLPRDAAADRGRPPLPRAAAPVPHARPAATSPTPATRPTATR